MSIYIPLCIFSYKDHAYLFNSHLERWTILQALFRQMSASFPSFNPNHEIEESFKYLHELIGG